MISVQTRISNPWSNRWASIFGRHGMLSQHRAWEFNVYKTNCLINVDLSITTHTDHAGVHLMLGLLGFELELHVYDTRHWNHDAKTWATYE